MGEALKHVLDFFKQKLTVWISLAIALAVFLFLPANAAKQLGIFELRQKYGGYVACLFIVTLSLIVVHLFAYLIKHLSKKKEIRQEEELLLEIERKAIESLHRLLPTEKQILCGYILRNEKTQYLSIQDGNVTGLCRKNILYQASSVGNLHGRGFAYNIQDWAWDYLQEHQELITEGVPTDSQGRIIGYHNPYNILGDI